jgi:hypothetical protein
VATPPPSDQTTSDETAPDAAVASAPNATGPVDQAGPVAVGEVNVFDGDPVGLLDDTNGGLGRDLWVNARRDDLEKLLDAAPLNSKDPVIADLSRRLLLTESESPVGSGKRSLIAVRLQKLLEGGFVEEAGALAIKAHLPNDADFARLQAKAILLAGDVADACGDATVVRLTDGDVFWLQLRAYCFAVSGDQEQVDLIDQLLDAQGHTDADYKILRDDAVKHLNYMPGAIADPSPVHVFLLKVAGLPVPPELIAKFHLDRKAMTNAPAPTSVFPALSGNPGNARRYALEIGLTDALNYPIPARDQPAAVTAVTTRWTGARPSEDEMHAIADASSQPGRKGEAILRIIEAIDARGIGNLAPDVTIRLVKDLIQLGLGDIAKEIGAEALRDYREPPTDITPVTQ